MNGVIDAAIFATSPGSRGADDHATLSTCDLYDATSDVGAARTVTDYLLEELCDLRAVLGLRLHRFGYEADDQKQELRRYLFGRRLVKRIDMTQPLHAILRRLHASITSGQEGDSSFREVNVASISRHEGAQANVNRTRHQDVPRLIEETEARILRSSVLSPFERAALVYFEILNIHPFRDGNGRVARLIAGRLLGGVARLAFPIDITSISRTALGPGYHVLHAGRAPSSYRLWIAYMRGLYAAEIQSIARLCDALASLHSDDETQLRAVIVDALDAVEDGRSFIEIVAAAQAKARPAVARLLVTIAAPTLGRSSGHKRTAMEGNR